MGIGQWWTTKRKVVVAAVATAVLIGEPWPHGPGPGTPTASTRRGPDPTDEPERPTTTTTFPATTSTIPTTTTPPSPNPSSDDPNTTPSTPPPTTAPREPVPGLTPDVGAPPGGGCQEIAVSWGPAAGATGYRILQCDQPDGRYVVTADIDVTTGAVTKAADVTTIWSATHNDRPGAPGLATPEPRRPGSSTSTWVNNRGGTSSSPTTPRARGRRPPSWGPARPESGGEVGVLGEDRLAAPLGLLPVLLPAECGEVGGRGTTRPVDSTRGRTASRCEDAPVDLEEDAAARRSSLDWLVSKPSPRASNSAWVLVVLDGLHGLVQRHAEVVVEAGAVGGDPGDVPAAAFFQPSSFSIGARDTIA